MELVDEVGLLYDTVLSRSQQKSFKCSSLCSSNDDDDLSSFCTSTFVVSSAAASEVVVTVEGTTALLSLLLLKNLCMSSVLYKHSEPHMLDGGGVRSSFCLDVAGVSSLALVVVVEEEEVVMVFIGCTDLVMI